MATPPASPFYVTTPIYYVNAVPHLGTFYTTVVADALARFHRARDGRERTFFLTGLDEHGQKIERMARDKGQEPKAYCDDIAARFKETWTRVGIDYDRFIRTTDADHEAAVLDMWRRMEATGDIYAADYEGLYCVGCEDWKTEDELVARGDQKVCPVHDKPVELVKEKNYFFRLSKYQDRLLAFYEANRDFIRPESRHNEVVSFVRGGLKDLSVSRMSVKWGIPVPGNPQHTIYVWIDALTNYLSAIGGPGAVTSDDRARALWAQSHHLIAKDILRFHAVYWPAMLMSVGLPPPRAVFCHGYLTVKGQKISKSLPATRVDPNAIADELGVDPLRYFVLREYTFGADGDFTYEALFQRYESDLGNDLGNLANRTIAMARKNLGEAFAATPLPAAAALGDFAALEEARTRAERAWGDFQPSRALEATWEIVRGANAYIDRSAPWKLAKEGKLDELRAVLATCLQAIRTAARMVAPAMPQAARELLRQIGREEDATSWPTALLEPWPGGTLTEPKPVFPRLDPDKQKDLLARWTGEVAGAAPAAPAAAASPTAPGKASPGKPADPGPSAAPTNPAPEGPPAEITIDDFARIDLRAAKVLTAERVPKTEKLLKLTLDLGTEQRTVVSGIAAAYAPEALIGKTVVYLANLKPAKLRGVLSQGMILAAGDHDVLALSAFDREVPPGTKVR